MNDAGGGLSIAVLGDSSATLYYQDPVERAAVAGAPSWPELLSRLIGDDVTVTNLAGVGQQLSQGLRDRYALLDSLRPDVVLISHGGREGIVALPRLLAWLRCYAHNESPYRGRHRLRQRIRRPLWAALVTSVTRHPRLCRALLRPLNIRPVDADTKRFRRDLQELVAGLADRQARVVLMPSFLGHHSFWPLFPDVVAANAATFRDVAASDDRVSLLDLQPRVVDEDFTGDGAHLTVAGHQRVARMVVAHILELTRGADAPLPVQPRVSEMAVA